MIKRAIAVLGIALLTAGVPQPNALAATPQVADAPASGSTAKGSSAKQEMTEGSATKDDTAQGSMTKGTVLLHETFEKYQPDSKPKDPQLERSDMVTVVESDKKVGTGKVARFNDSDETKGGSLEYNLGSSAASNLYIEFDAINNDPAKGDKSSTVIFGAGPWEKGKSLMVNSKSKRAFGFEMYQQKYLKLRVGDEKVADLKYDLAAAFNVKIWVNDHDGNTLSYKRPDNGETAALNPNSVVIWVNNTLLGNLKPVGHPMNKEVTEGDAVLGRIGLSSSSTKVSDFLFDNLHVEDPSGASKPGSSVAPKVKPAALFLTSAVTDLSPETGYTSERFGDDAMALSPVHQLDAKMPPTLILHATFDDLVHYSTAVALYNKLESTGNACDLISVPVGGHGFESEHKQWKSKVNTKLETFLKRKGLLPAVK